MAKANKSGNDDLARLLTTRREQLGLSRRDIVEATGLSYPYVSQLETGYRMPSPTAAGQLAKALGLSLEEIFALDVPAAEQIDESRQRASRARPRRLTLDDAVEACVRELDQLPATVRLEAIARMQVRVMETLIEERLATSRS